MAWSEDLIEVSTAETSNVECLKIVRFSINLDFPPSITITITYNLHLIVLFSLSRRVLFCLFNINVTLGLTSGSILVRKLAKRMWLLPAAVAVIIAIQTGCFCAYFTNRSGITIWRVRVKDDNSV